MVEGSGSQTDPLARWGDYTAMHIDPVDNCRFWYPNQYCAVTSARGWQTRIATFRLPGCTWPSPSSDAPGVGLRAGPWRWKG